MTEMKLKLIVIIKLNISFFIVLIDETYLVAEQTEIAFSVLGNDPVLSCHILPHMLDRTVHYCRWIRPDGYGIHNDISHRYTTSSSYSEYRLVILKHNVNQETLRNAGQFAHCFDSIPNL